MEYIDLEGTHKGWVQFSVSLLPCKNLFHPDLLLKRLYNFTFPLYFLETKWN